MEGLGTGISLETLLTEAQQHTVLLSDLRENSEVRRKTDEKTLTQLQKLQQATSQTLEVAKAHKQQSKETSTTLKAINEATVNANAINAKRQTSALNTLSRTIDVGLTVVNRKMFSLIEKLGSSLAGAFASVGRSLENKLYGFMGDLSILVRPIIGVVKLGFKLLTTVLAVPLKMIWTGLKAFSNTLIGKLVIFGGMLYLGYKFLTGTEFGRKISSAVWDGIKAFASAHPLLTVLTSGIFIAKVITPIVTAIKGVGSLVGWIGSKAALLRGASAAGTAAAGAGSGALTAAAVGTGAAGYFTSKKDARKYLQKHNINTRGMSDEQMLTKANSYRAATEMPKPTSPTMNATASASKLSKLGKYASMGGKAFKIGGGIGGALGGAALDYAADHVENKTASGLLNVGSAALSGAAFGAMFGGPIGAAIGGVLGAGASLIAGEGGRKLFGSSDEETEMDALANMQEQQAQASNAQIHSLDDIAEAIRESNKTLTRVVEKMSTDSQQNVNRREANSTEQARHIDAVDQMKMTYDTNQLLADVVSALQQIGGKLGINISTNASTTSVTIPKMS